MKASRPRPFGYGVAALGVAAALALGATGCSSHASSGCDGGPSCGHEAGQVHLPPPHDAGAPKPVCSPTDLGDFQPVPIKPLTRVVCTDAQIHAIASACFGSAATDATCKAAKDDPANESCMVANCLFSAFSPVPVTLGATPIPPAEGPWGPVVTVSFDSPVDASTSVASGLLGFDTFDLGACLLAEDPTDTACAQTASALFQCETAACAANCPFSSTTGEAADIAAYKKCTKAADVLSSACKKFSDLFQACFSAVPHSFCYAADATAVEMAMKKQCGVPADGGVCLPADVWAFKPVTITPLVQPACTAAQIHSFVMACYDVSATAATCNSWFGMTSNQSCSQTCLYTAYSNTSITPGMNPVPPAQPSWGPFMYVLDTMNGQLDYLDLGGCIQLADPSQAACGQLSADFLQCGIAACGANCPLPNSGSSSAASQADFQALNNCQNSAAYTGCRRYFDGLAECLSAIPAGSPAQFCFDGSLSSSNPTTRDNAFEKFVTQQCGQPDAGALDAGGG